MDVSDVERWSRSALEAEARRLGMSNPERRSRTDLIAAIRRGHGAPLRRARRAFGKVMGIARTLRDSFAPPGTPGTPPPRTASVPRNKPPTAMPKPTESAAPAPRGSEVEETQPETATGTTPPLTSPEAKQALPGAPEPALEAAEAVVSESKPQEDAESALQDAAKPAVQDAAEPALQDAAEPALQEPAEPALQEPAEPALQEPAESALQDAAEPAPQEATEPALQEAAEPAPQEATEPTPQEAAEPALQEPAEPALHEAEPALHEAELAPEPNRQAPAEDPGAVDAEPTDAAPAETAKQAAAKAKPGTASDVAADLGEASKAAPIEEPESPSPDPLLEALNADKALRKSLADEPIPTRTMARLLARQGHRRRALGIYRKLLLDSPDDQGLRKEINRLRDNAPGVDGDNEVALVWSDDGLLVAWSVTDASFRRCERVLGGEGVLRLRAVLVLKPGQKDVREHEVPRQGERLLRGVPQGARITVAVGLAKGDRFVSIAHAAPQTRR